MKKKLKKNSYVWMINLIHDYENFCRKLPFWSLSLSLSKDNEIIFSIIHNPILDILIFSEKGSGSVNNQEGKLEPHHHQSKKLLVNLITYIFPIIYHLIVLSLNSISIEIVYLCLG